MGFPKKSFAKLVLILLAFPGVVLAQTSLPPEDVKVLEDKIVLLHEAWNRHDMAAYTSQMTDDVHWINVVGDWWKGKPQVFATLDRYHKTIFKERQLYPAEKLTIRQIAPGVVVTTMINPADAYTNSSGVQIPPTRNVLTLVWVKRDSAWLIAQAQNTIEGPIPSAKPR